MTGGSVAVSRGASPCFRCRAPQPTVDDVADNPKNLQIVELEAAPLPRSLQDVDTR